METQRKKGKVKKQTFLTDTGTFRGTVEVSAVLRRRKSCSASTLMVEFVYPQDLGDTLFQNVRNHLQDYMTS
jgi:hypothetical protein